MRTPQHSAPRGFGGAMIWSRGCTWPSSCTPSPSTPPSPTWACLLPWTAAVAYEAIKTATAKYLRAQLELAAAAHVAQEAGVAVHEVRTSWLQVSAEQAVLEARVEWTRKTNSPSSCTTPSTPSSPHRASTGYDPTFNLDDIKTAGPSS